MITIIMANDRQRTTYISYSCLIVSIALRYGDIDHIIFSRSRPFLTVITPFKVIQGHWSSYQPKAHRPVPISE